MLVRSTSVGYWSFGLAAPGARRPSLGRGTADPGPGLRILRFLALPSLLRLVVLLALALAVLAGGLFLLPDAVLATGFDFTGGRWLAGVLACNFGTACSCPRLILRARLGDSIFAFAVTSALMVCVPPEFTAAAYSSSYDATRQS